VSDRPDDDIDGGASPEDSRDATSSVGGVNKGEGGANAEQEAGMAEVEGNDALSAASALAAAVNEMQAFSGDPLDEPQLPPTTTATATATATATDDLIDDFDDIFGVLSDSPGAAAGSESDPAGGQAAPRQIEGAEPPTPPAAPLDLSSFSAGAHTRNRKRRR
jgi:hypothetical protein